ncbi:hypothetical protein BDF21DRAFT_449543 [Thamnidium elegans]|nr:hypothetical protein BDF21DRAFT_449543 [Thamnidium elegans]
MPSTKSISIIECKVHVAYFACQHFKRTRMSTGATVKASTNKESISFHSRGQILQSTTFRQGPVETPLQAKEPCYCVMTFTNEKMLSEQLRLIVSEVTESDGLDAFREKIQQEKYDESEFLEGIYRSLIQCFDRRYEAYTSPFADDNDEDTFSQLYIWPFMTIVATCVYFSTTCTASGKGKIGFKTGQPQLESMSTQLKAVGIIVDDKSCYRTDGLLSFYGTRRIEMLLLEMSGQFGNSDQTKIKFDHHKAMFGLLAMMKIVAGDGLQLWSLVYQEVVFDFWQEATLTILPKFEDVDTFLPELVKFFWSVKAY